MTKILQIAYRMPFPDTDGGAIGIKNIAMGLQQAGAEVHFLGYNTQKHYVSLSEIPAYFKDKIDITSIAINNNPSILGALVNLLSSKSFHEVRFQTTAMEVALVKVLKLNSFDIIHIDGPFMAWLIPIIRQNSKAKIVIRAHNLEFMIWKRIANESKHSLKKWYFNLQAERIRKLELNVFKNADAVIAITAIDQKYIAENQPLTKTFISPAGVDLQRFCANDSPLINNSSICFLGSLEWLPNQEGMDWFLDKVWPLVTIKNPNIVFNLAGRRMPERFKNSNLHGLNAVGEVESAVDFLNNNSIVIVPLLSGSGMRIKIIEAMSLGRIVISTSVGAEGLHVEHLKNILIADKIEDFANWIIEVENNFTDYLYLGENAKKIILEQYNNQDITHQLLQFYKSL